MNERPQPSSEMLLLSRLERLCKKMDAGIGKIERKHRAYVIAGTILVLACVFSLSSLTSMAFKLDAQAIAEIGRQNVESNLPQSREMLGKYLQDMAPELTSQAIVGIQALLPSFRPLILGEMESNLRGISSIFEQDLTDLMDASVRASKADLDQAFSSMSDTEKLDLLVSAIGERFNENVRTAFTALHADYSREIGRVESYLVGLRDRPAEQLTPRERIDKEIIETLLKLVAREGVSPVPAGD